MSNGEPGEAGTVGLAPPACRAALGVVATHAPDMAPEARDLKRLRNRVAQKRYKERQKQKVRWGVGCVIAAIRHAALSARGGGRTLTPQNWSTIPGCPDV